MRLSWFDLACNPIYILGEIAEKFCRPDGNAARALSLVRAHSLTIGAEGEDLAMPWLQQLASFFTVSCAEALAPAQGHVRRTWNVQLCDCALRYEPDEARGPSGIAAALLFSNLRWSSSATEATQVC